MTHKVVLLLASNSPRRRALLSLGGWMFNLVSVEIDEKPIPEEDPREYVVRMATHKAMAAASHLRPEGAIIAADTAVVDRNEILGKPDDAKQAVDMLKRLRGRTHQVYTALAVMVYGDRTPIIDVCTTDVPMRYYSDEEIMKYVASGDPFDKAGAYAIQNENFHPAMDLDGCYANVVGLPLCHLTRTLKRLQIPTPQNVPQECQKALNYQCPIYERVLKAWP